MEYTRRRERVRQITGDDAGVIRWAQNGAELSGHVRSISFKGGTGKSITQTVEGT